MIRQRLKSRNGCDRCRFRRKKCDEQHPTCHSCARWNILCTWSRRGIPGNGQPEKLPGVRAGHAGGDSQPLITRQPALSSHQDGLLANGYQPFSDDREFYLASTCPLILAFIITPFATGPERDTSRFTSLVLLDPSVRAAWIGFAAKILTPKGSYPESAQQSYQSAVIGTRKALENGRTSSQRLTLLASMVFMALYEIYGNGDPDLAFVHVTAILILACDLVNKTHLAMAQSEYMFLKHSIEWSFLTAANTAIYQSDLSIFRRINWCILNNVLTDSTLYCYTDQAFPFLHGRAELLSIMSQVTVLAREPPSEHIQVQIMGLGRRLDAIENPSLRNFADNVPADLRKMFTLRWPFLVRSVRIYMLKVVSRGACSGIPSVRALVRESSHALRMMEIDSKVNSQWAIWPLPRFGREFGVHRNQGMFWHILILMSAAHENETLEILEERRKSLVGSIPWRHHSKMDRLREIIQVRKKANLKFCTASSGIECMIPHDGLDFLLHKNGIFGILDEVDQVVLPPSFFSPMC